MSAYHILTLTIFFLVNLVAFYLVGFVSYAIIKYDIFRKNIVQSIQDGDEVSHTKDAVNFTRWIQGILCSWFTGNIGLVIMYEKMFDPGSLTFLGMFIAVTFTLLGIAWKKPIKEV